jgi:hypothetical protein
MYPEQMEDSSSALLEELPSALSHAAEALARVDRPAARIAGETLRKVEDGPQGAAAVEELKSLAGLQGDSLERLLLWHAAQTAHAGLGALPVDPWVRSRLGEDVSGFPTAAGSLAAGSYAFSRAAKMATLRRFPAGPMEWEFSGIPRSWLLKQSPARNLQLLWFVATRLRGLAPCFFMHVAPYPRNRALVLEKEVLKSYHRMARALRLQPEIRAILGHAWFFDPAAVRDHPHLQALNRPFRESGGTIAVLDAAAADSGILEGNLARKRDYLEGKLQYRYGLAIWPRKAAIQWAEAHPELAQ